MADKDFGGEGGGGGGGNQARVYRERCKLPTPTHALVIFVRMITQSLAKGGGYTVPINGS